MVTKDIDVMREHLYRCHALPIHCARCCLTFKSEAELKKHYRSPNTCDLHDDEPPDISTLVILYNNYSLPRSLTASYCFTLVRGVAEYVLETFISEPKRTFNCETSCILLYSGAVIKGAVQCFNIYSILIRVIEY